MTDIHIEAWYKDVHGWVVFPHPLPYRDIVLMCASRLGYQHLRIKDTSGVREIELRDVYPG
jgi:hypothetical protein